MGAGRSPDAGAWRQVASCLATVPLWLGPPPADGPAPALAVGEAAGRLVELVGGELRPARAFGRPWWLVVTARGVLAPGVPGLVAAPDDLLDARYWRDGEGIVREAQARSDRVVSDAAASSGSTTPAVAVWFSEAERLCLFPERLDISNHHLRAVVPASAATVARVVAASAPALAAATAAWPSPAAGVATLEVGRALPLLAAGWDDPDRFLAARVEVASVSGAQDRRLLRLVNGDVVELTVSSAGRGFTLAVTAGPWLYSRLTVAPDGERVVVRVEPAAEIDLAAAPTRARLAFDLTATLLALAG